MKITASANSEHFVLHRVDRPLRSTAVKILSLALIPRRRTGTTSVQSMNTEVLQMSLRTQKSLLPLFTVADIPRSWYFDHTG